MVMGFWGHRSKACLPPNAVCPGSQEVHVARRERNGSTTLEVRIIFEPNRLSPGTVAQAYERVVPITRHAVPRARAARQADDVPPMQQRGRRQHA
jgi:hypothetical protein